jgi:hypothetical protein
MNSVVLQPSPLEYSRIVPGLRLGSAPPGGSYLTNDGCHVLVLTAIECQYHGVDFPGVQVVRAPNHDADRPPTKDEIQIACAAARHVVNQLRNQKNVLVTCRQGRNRSAFVVALVLHVGLGWSGKRAVEFVRRARTPALKDKFGPNCVLSNGHFVRLLESIRGV